jgi:poly(A) polymerase
MGATLTQLPDYRLNLDHAIEEDQLLRPAVASAGRPDRLYVYGDYVLQGLKGRPPGNILIASRAPTDTVARELARASGLKLLALKNNAGGFHLAGPRFGERGITVVPLAGSGIRENLADCGFSVTAIAVDLSSRTLRELVDPFGGLEDLANARLRAVSSNAFINDPARILQAAELAFPYGLRPDSETEVLMGASAHLLGTLPCSRVWPVLLRLFGGEELSGKARFLAGTGALGALLPEVEATYEVPQNYYHHLGVWEHTLEVLDVLEGVLQETMGSFRAFAGRISTHMGREIVPGADRRSFLGFAALIHDIGKPVAMTCEPSGRIRFQGHQVEGARLTAGIAARMGLGRRCAAHLVGVVADHMRLGFLLKEGESTETRLRTVRELGGRCIEVVLLSLADRIATRGPASTTEAMELYKRVTSRVLADYFWDIDYPPLVDGHDVMMHAGMVPGPEVGRALFKARVAQREAIVSSRDQALEYLAPDFKGKMNM